MHNFMITDDKIVEKIIIQGKVVLNMKPLKVKVSVTLDEPMVEKIKQLAEDDDRSLSQYINLILKKYFAAREAKEQGK